LPSGTIFSKDIFSNPFFNSAPLISTSSAMVKTLEKVRIQTVESGSMTKDLAMLIGKNQKYLTTNQFLEVIDSNLKRSLN